MTHSTTFSSPLNVLFDPETKQKLDALTDNGRLSRAHVIRQLVQHAHRMSVAGLPTCANGHSCYCPHVHQQITRT